MHKSAMTRSAMTNLPRAFSSAPRPGRLCLAVLLFCLAAIGCHRMPGANQHAMFTPTHARDEAIRKKADADTSFPAAGQSVSEAPIQTSTAAPRSQSVRVR